MATQGETNICIFHSLRSDGLPAESPSRLSAHLEIGHENFKKRHDDEVHVPISSFILTAWALLLRTYLATKFISFASLGVDHGTSTLGKDGKPACRVSENALVHSFEIEDRDTISDTLRRISEPNSQKRLNPALLSSFNTMLLHRLGTTEDENRSLEEENFRMAREVGRAIDGSKRMHFHG
ncbi:hypothetical protein XA68_13376 [Ophiocordyceps unilateralis]|uniref:Uncharacterized protein n=1 Tax=Ophiocordyceps unilateralis TaxID=268505 RepID=A0A2A9PMM0_OPHUN|nr:hypothetical protein XA68_13376 [Ophiocordyceps unilateralis]